MATLLGESLFGLFTYNKQNYRYDRELRQKMEYQLVDMRLKQAELWRNDVRTVVSLTLTKMEAYLLVIALELGCCVTALCKGRVPPGAPPWLAAAHTLSLTGAFAYLFMALWMGLHAYVAAQAYKVRILTHFARLPIPDWQTIEAGRTYESSFEKMKPTQMLRVPFVMGAQEASCFPRPQTSMALQQTTSAPTQPSALSTPPGEDRELRGEAAQGETGAQAKAADPWGLERRGDDILELAADVNEKTERQKHIWRCRSAAQLYETYDAFCRISMSTGTCSLATHLCYYCLTYVLTEMASPAAAWSGMLVYACIAMGLLRLDMKLTGPDFYCVSFLTLTPPMICAVVTFLNSKGRGDVGAVEYYTPFVPLLHGLWYVFYLSKFQIKELDGGALLPSAFVSVLYLDSFGWAKLQQSRSAPKQSAPPLVSPSMLQTFNDVLFGERSHEPSMQVLNPAAPGRPEDTAPQASSHGAEDVSFKASTFAMASAQVGQLDDEDTTVDTGSSEKPGAIPWQTYRWTTIIIALLWFSASLANIVSLARGNKDYEWFKSRFKDLGHGQVHHGSLHALQVSGKVSTTFASLLTRPRGLSCDHHGEFFLTSGLDSNGQESLLHSQLSTSGLHFEHLPQHCLGPDDVMEDVTLQRCGEQDTQCAALVLARRGERLLPCRVPSGSRRRATNATSSAPGGGFADNAGKSLAQTGSFTSMALPLHRAWLDDRGGAPPDSSPHEDSGEAVDDHPEDISTMVAIPCGANEAAQCLVVGTTARRVVKLVATQIGTARAWVPRRILSNDVGEVPGPGAFALLGERHLGVLLRSKGVLRVLDLENGGTHAVDLQLPKEQLWSSVCVGGGNIFALEHGDDPSLWRFAAPAELGGSVGPTVSGTSTDKAGSNDGTLVATDVDAAADSASISLMQTEFHVDLRQHSDKLEV